MRFILACLVVLVSGVVSTADEGYYYLLPFGASVPSSSVSDVERVEMDIEGVAFVFDPSSWKIQSYFESRKLMNAADRELVQKIFPHTVFFNRSTTRQCFLLVRTEKQANSKITRGETKQTITTDQAATGDDHTFAYRYYILAQCLYYQQLAENNASGWPFFRNLQHHFEEVLNGILEENGFKIDRERFRGTARRSASGTELLDLFSGTEAIRRNLDLRTVPNFSGENARTVDMDSIEGITLAEIDWKELIADDPMPKLDLLAHYVPHDQHFVVFPSGQAAMQVLEQVSQSGLAALMTPVSIQGNALLGADSGLVEKYLGRLGLTPEILGKLAASPHLKTVAITGSDPYFQEGTDIAVLLETDDPAKLLALFPRNLRHPLVHLIDSKIILLTNSWYQVEQIKGVINGKKSLADLEEFRYFRTLYKIGEEETAFVFLSDATIRRWCSPRWRIGQARSLQQQSRLAEITVERLGDLVQQNINDSEIISPFTGNTRIAPELLAEYRYTLSNYGVRHEIYGTFSQLTPIAELPIDKISEAEKQGYEQWRTAYERAWRGIFDPIGIRLVLGENVTKTDVTVLPLILTAQSSLGFLFPVIESGRLVHTEIRYDVPMQYIVALGALPQENVGDELSWVGNYVSVYFDEDPFWDSFTRQIENGSLSNSPFLEDGTTLPVVLEIDSKDQEKLTDYINSMIGLFSLFIGSPDVQKLEYNNVPYFLLRSNEEKAGIIKGKIVICIATGEDRLIVSLNENAMKRAIDRSSHRETVWLGANLGLKFDNRLVGVADVFLKQSFDKATQQGNLRNRELFELYKKHDPAADPVEIHQRLFGERLLRPEEMPECPTLTGLQSAEFGITLENDGLRAKGEVHWGNER